MKLTEKQIENIADNLDSGMRCFYNIKTGEIKTILNFDSWIGADEEPWEEESKEIDGNWGDYFEFEELQERADIVVFGKLIAKESFWNPSENLIFTSNLIEVFTTIKGSDLETVEVITNGGMIGSQFQSWSNSVQIDDAKGYFFLKNVSSNQIREGEFSKLLGKDGFIPSRGKEVPNIQAMELVNDTIVEFEFDNILFEYPNFLNFDVLIRTNVEGLEFGKGELFTEYPDNVFGSNVDANENLKIEKGTVIDASNYVLQSEDFSENIFRASIVGGCAASTPNFTTGIPLTTEFQRFLSIRMEIQDLSAIGTISLDSFQMDGNVYYFNPENNACLPFDTIIYPNPIETGLICNIMAFEADFDPDNPDRIAAGTANILTIIGEDFGDNPGAVQFQNADDVDPPIDLVSTEIVDFEPGDWTPNQIRVKVPSAPVTAGSGIFQVVTEDGMICLSPAPLEVCFAITTFRSPVTDEVRKIHLADYPDDGNGEFVFRLEDDLEQNMNARDAIEMALCDWNAETEINWVLGDEYNNEDGNGIDQSPDIDEVNHIFLADAAVFQNNPAASMRTIIGGERILDCDDFTTLPPSPIFYTTDIDIAVREDLNLMIPPVPGGWNFDPNNPPNNNQLDFYSIILHELGHAHLLSHALPDDKMMYPNSDPGVPMRNISDKDELGGEFALNFSEAALNDDDAVGCPTPVGTEANLCLNSTFDNYLENDVVIFPNPFLNRLSFDLEIAGNYEVSSTIHDLLGRQIFVQNYGKLSAGEHTIDLAVETEIESGIYFLSISIGEASRAFKIIKF